MGRAGLCCPRLYQPDGSARRPDWWDYLAFDAASGNVLVSHADHVDIVAPRTGRLVGRLDGLHGSHGEAAAGEKLYADSGETGTLSVYDAKTFKLEKTIPAGKDADGVVFDPVNNVIAVMNGDPATATLIDATTNTWRATVKLGGEPEFAVADGTGRIFIDLASTSQIAVLDVAHNSVTARYDVPDCQSPHGAAMDATTKRLFVSCHNEKLVVVDAASGRELQSLPIGKGTDAAAFDPRRRLVFSSNGIGTLSIFQEDSQGKLTKAEERPTAPGARTMATDPATGDVFLVTADRLPPATAGARPTTVAGTVRLMVLMPK